MNNEAGKYKIAARRQLEIAEYFLKQLRELYKSNKIDGSGNVKIEIQAYFEGCIRAAYSCLDKLVAGKLSFKGKSTEDDYKDYKEEWGRVLPADFVEQHYDFLEELRKLRNDATHNFTDKIVDREKIIVNVGSEEMCIKKFALKALCIAHTAYESKDVNPSNKDSGSCCASTG